MIKYVDRYTREDVKENFMWWYVFGDNMQERGLGGQAKACRGEPNTVGIPTKWKPSMTEDSFFTDDDYDAVAPKIYEAFDRLGRIMYIGSGIVVWPSDGIGTGLAQLEKRAPKIFALIQERKAMLEKLCD